MPNPEWPDPPGWNPEPRGAGWGPLVALLVSCGLWAAIIVPLIIWG